MPTQPYWVQNTNSGLGRVGLVGWNTTEELLMMIIASWNVAFHGSVLSLIRG